MLNFKDEKAARRGCLFRVRSLRTIKPKFEESHMSTVAQITARQLNANLSTSPRSPKGKSASAQNATKHGLTCAYPVIRSEERTRFQTLIAKSEHEIRPVERNLFKARSELKANRHSYKLQKRTPVNFEQNKSKCIEIPDCRMREPKTTANNSSPHQWATPFLGQAKSPSAAMQISIQYSTLRIYHEDTSNREKQF